MEFGDLIKTAKVDNVILWRPHSHKKLTGTLCLTSHHILFSDRTSDDGELMLLYMSIEHLERKLSGTAGIISIICKDFTTLKIKINGQEEAFNVAASIEALSTFESASLYYPFFFNNVSYTIDVDGWKLFQMQEEYKNIIGESDQWRVSSVNENNEVSTSYPKYNMVPAAANDELIKRVAKFRQDGRFPVLCYLHHNKVPLLRSSQPLNGQSNKRNKDDEKLLACVLAGHTLKGQIIDTRSNSVATSHRGKGGGYESSQYYPQWIRAFENLERPSYLGDSISAVYQACIDRKSSSWFSKLESSGWMSCIQDIMTVTLKIVAHIHLNGAPVLVHGERGGDMTLQLTSLSQVLMNPDCRTILGFQALIVREWLWGGYAFTERHLKVGVSPARKKEHAPVFLLFLDCVHQVMTQYPNSFEFDEDFLLLIANHSYSSEYGTFLFNNEFQREQARISQTFSFWSHVNREDELNKLRNPVYERNSGVLWPSVAPQSLCLWCSLFLKNLSSVSEGCQHEMKEMIITVKSQNMSLKEKARLLQQQYEQLQTQYTQAHS